MRTCTAKIIACLFWWSFFTWGHSAGTLTPKGSPGQAIQIKDHQVHIVINNGFSSTEVLQTFFNPNPQKLEGIYSFPVPKSASLSEVTIYYGEQEIHGEVLPKKEAQTIYEEERNQGNNAGLAKKNEYQTFEFAVANIPSQNEIKIRFLYYQPVSIDTGVGRYLYPLQDGGTDEEGKSFWDSNNKVEENFSINLELKSSWPVENIRMPSYDQVASVEKVSDGNFKVTIKQSEGTLDKDFVFYYRLKENLPGRIEMISYKPEKEKIGTFMMVVTPGLDLKPVCQGADYVFVLDTSGSMEGKIRTLTQGVKKTLQKMDPSDRIRIVTFNDQAQRLTPGWVPASLENVNSLIVQIDALQAGGSTNFYEGLSLALENLDDDRVTCLIPVTDGVTNTGVLAPQAFYKLLKKYDVRIFGFLLGNSSNWPLMETICEASGGFYQAVSNDDDIIGQILLAKSKIKHECLHDASLMIRGVKVFDTSDELLGKVYRGQQLVMFGRYQEAGEARVSLKAKLSGEDKEYSTSFCFPEVDTDHPELERLWALNRIEVIEARERRNEIQEKESEKAIQSLGVSYQIVTDYTSMVVLSDETFLKRNIQRNNQQRIALERTAQSQRNSLPIRNYQVDSQKPAFSLTAPSLGGGGDLDFPTVAIMVFALVLVFCYRKRREVLGKPL